MKAAFTIGIETFSRVLADEAAELVRQHYEEIAWKQDKIKLNPDYARYDAMQAKGMLRVFTARQDGILLGYCVFILSKNLHYKDLKVASNDVFFVEKNARGVFLGSRLLKHAEDALKAEGVGSMGLHIKVWENWSALAERLGFERTEFIYQKFLGD